MTFRRDGKLKHEAARRWAQWLDANQELVDAAGLTRGILRSERDWWDFIEYTYHQVRADKDRSIVRYDASRLSHGQAAALWLLIQSSVATLLDSDQASPHWLTSLKITYGPRDD